MKTKNRRKFRIVSFANLSGFEKQKALKLHTGARSATQFRKYDDNTLTVHPKKEYNEPEEKI